MLGHDLAALLPCRLLGSQRPICNSGEWLGEARRMIEEKTMVFILPCIVAQTEEGR